MNKRWTLPVKYNEETDEHYIEFSDEILEASGFNIGDKLKWIDQKDGSYLIEKEKKTQWVLVECVSQFRERYMVEVPVGKTDWALDTVSMEEAKEFSQKFLGETIVSHRVVTEEEAISMCDVDNQYCTEWDKDKKIDAFFTQQKEWDNDQKNIS
jgi:hypothetical protein